MMLTGSLDDELSFITMKMGYHLFKLQRQAEAIWDLMEYGPFFLMERWLKLTWSALFLYDCIYF